MVHAWNFLAPLLLILAAAEVHVRGQVWPPPQDIVMRGGTVALAPTFAAVTHGAALQSSRRLARAIARFEALVAPAKTIAARAAAMASAEVPLPVLDSLVLLLSINTGEGLSTTLGAETRYDYTLNVSASGRDGSKAAVATVSAASIYGLMYGLETFAQLVDLDRGLLAASHILVSEHIHVNSGGHHCGTYVLLRGSAHGDVVVALGRC